MKRAIQILLIALISATFSGTALAAKKAGIGFAFGTLFQSHQKSAFKQGTASFFRLNFSADADSSFFLHTEQGGFNTEEGKGVSSSTKNAQAVGLTMSLAPSISFDVMVGGATVIIPVGGVAGTGNIAAANSSDPIAEIGVKWAKATGDTVLNVGLSYRSHKLSSGVVVTDSGGNAETINDMSSMNIGIDIGIGF